MSLYLRDEPSPTDREIHRANVSAEDELYLADGHPSDCECMHCMPELHDPAELEAGRGENGAAA